MWQLALGLTLAINVTHVYKITDPLRILLLILALSGVIISSYLDVIKWFSTVSCLEADSCLFHRPVRETSPQTDRFKLGWGDWDSLQNDFNSRCCRKTTGFTGVQFPPQLKSTEATRDHVWFFFSLSCFIAIRFPCIFSLSSHNLFLLLLFFLFV